MSTEGLVQERNTWGYFPTAWVHVVLSRAVLLPGTAVILLLLAVQCLAQAQTDEEFFVQSSGWSIDRWYIFTSIGTKHFESDPDHINRQKLLGIEAQMKNNWAFGLASFDNSFGQRSEYLYAGYKWPLFRSQQWYFKITGGLLYGYKEPFENKIPLNDLGVAPAILPTVGFRYKFFVTEVNLLGNAAVTVTAGISF